jgi:hypothetical protein
MLHVMAEFGICAHGSFFYLDKWLTAHAECLAGFLSRSSSTQGVDGEHLLAIAVLLGWSYGRVFRSRRPEGETIREVSMPLHNNNMMSSIYTKQK